MRVNAAVLVLLVVFAVLTMSVAVLCPIGCAVEGNVDSDVFSDVLHLNSGAVVKPQGIPIDDPVMPG
jgi:hypothetical protein